MPEHSEISIIIPVRNEAQAVPILARELEHVLARLEIAWECLWVDDGSTDATLLLLEDLHRRSNRQQFIALGKNSGQSAALLAGFDRARGRIMATLDGDLQSDPNDLPRLLPLLQRGTVDMVCGVRVKRQDSWWRRMCSWTGNRLRNMVTGSCATDESCAVRVFYRDCVDGLPRFRGLHRFLPTLIELRGFRWIEVPVEHRGRLFGRSKYGARNRLWPFFADTIGVCWLRHRIAKPVVKHSSLDETPNECKTPAEAKSTLLPDRIVTS
jgi:dolichol-phosphate mannosyltransferase